MCVSLCDEDWVVDTPVSDSLEEEDIDGTCCRTLTEAMKVCADFVSKHQDVVENFIRSRTSYQTSGCCTDTVR